LLSSPKPPYPSSALVHTQNYLPNSFPYCSLHLHALLFGAVVHGLTGAGGSTG